MSPTSQSDSAFERRPQLLAKVEELKETLALISKLFNSDGSAGLSQEKSEFFPNLSVTVGIFLQSDYALRQMTR
jgi:hypothetical protein